VRATRNACLVHYEYTFYRFEVVLIEGVTSIVYFVLLGLVVVSQVSQRAVLLRAVLPVPSSVKYRLVSLCAKGYLDGP